MSLKDDFDSFLQAWKDSSWIGRLVAAVAMFGSAGSLASLGDEIVKWRGFLWDAVELYRTTVTAPLQTLVARLVNWEISDFTADAGVVFLIFAGASVRAHHSQFLSAAWWIVYVFWGAGFGWHVLTGGAMGGSKAGTPEDWLGMGLMGAVLILLVVGAVDLAFFAHTEPNSDPDQRRRTISLFANLFIVVLLVLIAAAINLGLTAPLPP